MQDASEMRAEVGVRSLLHGLYLNTFYGALFCTNSYNSVKQIILRSRVIAQKKNTKISTSYIIQLHFMKGRGSVDKEGEIDCCGSIVGRLNIFLPHNSCAFAL